MDMWGAAGIGDRPDCAKMVAALPVCRRLPIALEVLVERRAGAVVSHIMVTAVCVALPDLDPHPGNRAPGRVENPPSQVDDGPFCHAAASGNVNQIIIRIARQRYWIERPGGLCWCHRQRRRLDGPRAVAQREA